MNMTRKVEITLVLEDQNEAYRLRNVLESYLREHESTSQDRNTIEFIKNLRDEFNNKLGVIR